jgi:hypothetical protein
MIYTIRGKYGSAVFHGRDVRAADEVHLSIKLGEMGITDWAITATRPHPTNWKLAILMILGIPLLTIGALALLSPPVPPPRSPAAPAPQAPPAAPAPRTPPAQPTPKEPTIACERFTLLVSGQTGDVLTIRVDTDLPDTAEAFVSVERTYRERGSDTVYSCDYILERLPIRDIRKGVAAQIDDATWQAAMRAQQRDMAAKGLGFRVNRASIGTDIKIRVVVHMRQPDPAFGPNNRRLVGKAVSKSGSGNVVVGEALLSRPFLGTVD